MLKDALKIVTVASSQIGTAEKPEGSNNVIYNTEYYKREVSGTNYPWCCVFVWWVFREAGLSPYFYGGRKTASCTTLMRHYKSEGKIVKEPQPGDLVLYNFNDKYSASTATHIGIVDTVTDYSISAIEGNFDGRVKRRKFPKNYPKVVAFARPFDDGIPYWATPYIEDCIDRGILDGSGLHDKMEKWNVAVIISKLIKFMTGE